MKNRKRIISITVIAVIVVAAVLLIVFGRNSEKNKLIYETAPVTYGNVYNSVTATGTIEPVTEVEVGTQVSGIIDKIYVDYNSIVKEGQLIAEMDKVTLESELASAKAQYEGSKAEYEYQTKNYERSKSLHEKSLISDTEYEQALYNYRMSESTFHTSEAALAKAEAVYADEDAVQAEVDAAYDELLEKVHLLDYKGNPTELQLAYDLAAAMDLSIYTDESRQVMEEAIAAAAEVLANENALQDEIDEALNNLNAAKDQLELKAVDKSELEKMIALADEYAGKIGSYTPDSAEAFQAAYDAAKTVFADAEAAQEEVDSAAAALQEAIDGLELAEEISTAVLEYALELAENVNTEGVIDQIVEIFNDTKASAQNILERAQAGDPSVTQDMVDESWRNLITIMQYMEFKQGDMTDLQKVVDLANSLDLTKYLDAGQQEFKDALAAAEAVLAEDFTEQTEIDQAWKDLLKAMSELRLKPSKEALEDLIASAESLSIEGTDEETAAVFRSALARAVSVAEDEQATEAEVASAEKELQTAIDQVLASAGGSTEKPSQTGSADENTSGSGQSGTGLTASSGSQNSGSDASKTSTSGSKAVKTGDSMFPIAGSAAAMTLAAAVIVLQRKKRS